MFSVLDYPDGDDAFRARCEREVEQQLALLQGSPCVMTICGNAEVEQQAAMSGVALDRPRHALFHEHLAVRGARACLPDVTYWPSTPWGGDLPFRVRTGTSHYFGVGAYRRPLHDARLAAACASRRSASPSPICRSPSRRRRFPSRARRVATAHGGRHACRVMVAHAGTSRTCAIHYVAQLFGVDAARLRADDPDRYLALGRATSAIVLERTMQEFRRRESPCSGALTWLWADPWDGAGWGASTSPGGRRARGTVCARASRPVAIALTNEGLDGVDLHVWNDTPRAVARNAAPPPAARWTRRRLRRERARSPLAAHSGTTYARSTVCSAASPTSRTRIGSGRRRTTSCTRCG